MAVKYREFKFHSHADKLDSCDDSCAGRKDHRCGADSAWNV